LVYWSVQHEGHMMSSGGIAKTNFKGATPSVSILQEIYQL